MLINNKYKYIPTHDILRSLEYYKIMITIHLSICDAIFRVRNCLHCPTLVLISGKYQPGEWVGESEDRQCCLVHPEVGHPFLGDLWE